MSVLGTVFETSLRILLLLAENPNDVMSEDRIWMLDYMALYSNDFGLSDRNLHGYGAYRAGEYPAKRALAQEAIKSLVLDRYVAVLPTEDGFKYSITVDGKQVCSQFTSDYSEDYIGAIKRVLKKMHSRSDSEIAYLIQQRAETDVEGAIG